MLLVSLVYIAESSSWLANMSVKINFLKVLKEDSVLKTCKFVFEVVSLKGFFTLENNRTNQTKNLKPGQKIKNKTKKTFSARSFSLTVLPLITGSEPLTLCLEVACFPFCALKQKGLVGIMVRPIPSTDARLISSSASFWKGRGGCYRGARRRRWSYRVKNNKTLTETFFFFLWFHWSMV